MILWEKKGQNVGKNYEKFTLKFFKKRWKPHCNHKCGIPLLVIYTLTCDITEKFAKKAVETFSGVLFAFSQVYPKLAEIRVSEIRINKV